METVIANLITVIVIGKFNLNDNLIRYKFASINKLIKLKSNIWLILETNLDETLPDTLFEISGYKVLH